MRDPRPPISPPLLESTCEQWVLMFRDEYIRALCNAPSLIASSGALRISELVAGGKVDNVKLGLQWWDIKVTEGSVELIR